MRATPLVRQLLAGSLPLEWAPARMVQRRPGQGPASAGAHRNAPAAASLKRRWACRASDAGPRLALLRADQGRHRTHCARWPKRGVRVRVLTNSLAATDVAPVHAGYAKYRKALLRGGVRLYELKPVGAADEAATAGRAQRQLGRQPARQDLRGRPRRIFVGSFNFDPRSARLNTEMGVVIDSPALATRLSQAFDRELPGNAYEVRLASDGDLEWIDGDCRAIPRSRAPAS